ncbi:PTS sugar transporter subunit IIA, partial [Clostridioides difficile]|uniref:PTS sugar transporter subunit IIA n=1 Tax=Clostridioides difficile TaxID=1496 RepID=UPI002FE6B55F
MDKNIGGIIMKNIRVLLACGSGASTGFMGNILYENKYVKPNYIDDVLIREKMSSTAFNNNVAIPHSMK